MRSRTQRLALALSVTVVGSVCALGAAPGAAYGDPGPATVPAEGKVIGDGAPGSIKGSYIVTLKKAQAKAGTDTGRAVVKAHGGSVSSTYSAVLNGYAVRMSGQQARRLAAHPAVESVSADRTFTFDGQQTDPPNWGLDRSDQQSLPLDKKYTYPDSAGEGVTAYVIDSGVNTRHKEFQGRATSGHDFVEGDKDASDQDGHGTHVASTVAGATYGVAKKAKVVAVRVASGSGGSGENVLSGIEWVAKHHSGPSVANFSMGGPASDYLDKAVRNCVASGVVFSTSAGNDGESAAVQSPARVKEALTVANSDRSDKRESSSNFGPVVDLFAPGTDITAGWVGGTDAKKTLTGTSMSSPHAAGAAAVYLGTHRNAAPAAVISALTRAATPGKITDPGADTPNRLLKVVD